MKTRLSFVTNSSSSSFLIAKKYLSEEQLDAIRNHSELGKRLKLDYAEESWFIDENEDFITGDTSMDNFNISELFDIIGIPSVFVHWSEFGFDLFDINEIENETVEDETIDWRGELHKILFGEEDEE